MIEHGFVSFIASDAHNEYRPLILKDAYDVLSEEFNETLAIQLTRENPRRILMNERIVPEYREMKKKKKRFLWR